MRGARHPRGCLAVVNMAEGGRVRWLNGATRTLTRQIPKNPYPFPYPTTKKPDFRYENQASGGPGRTTSCDTLSGKSIKNRRLYKRLKSLYMVCTQSVG